MDGWPCLDATAQYGMAGAVFCNPDSLFPGTKKAEVQGADA